MRLAAGLCPDPLGELIQRSPEPSSWILGVGQENEGKRERSGEERREKGRKEEGRDHPQ